MKTCKCGNNNYKWSVDELFQSWLKCADCGTNFFDDDIGVILINWRSTDINQISIDDVVKCNAQGNSVVTRQ